MLKQPLKGYFSWFNKKGYDRFIEIFFGSLFKLLNIKMPSKSGFYAIIFRSDSPAGKKFDIYLLYAIGISAFIPILNSIPRLHTFLALPSSVIEWLLTILFTIEYMLRIYCMQKPSRYIISFFGIVDALSIFPFYLGIFFPGLESVTTIRILRVLRVFRILNMNRFLTEASILLYSLRKSLHKILIFMMFVFLTSIILGAIMYSIEGNINPSIPSIPKGIYWAIVTLTTVGYGDITPVTNLGQIISGIIMILGYSVIAIPTGIISAEMMNNKQKKTQEKESELNRICINCGLAEHDSDAIFCKQCGYKIKTHS